MSIDWDAILLEPVMAVFGEGVPGDDESLPLYTPKGLAPFRLRDAVFDEQYEAVDVDTAEGAPSSSRKPVLGVRLALFPRDPRQSDVVFIPATGKSYVVREPRPDGHGHALLLLMERAA